MTQLTIQKTTEEFLQQGKNLKEQGLIDEAVSVYQQAIKIHENSYELYHFLGETLAATSQLELAIDAYQKAIKIHPQSHWSHHCLSLVYLWQSKYDQAIESCKNSIQINPEIYHFYNQMGLILNHKGEIEKSNIFYQRALDIESNNPDLEELDLEKILANTAQATENLQHQPVIAASATSPLQGNLEEVDGCLLKGWAWNAQKPDEKLTLIIYQNNQEIFRFVADRFREDLKQLGIGAGNHGFAIRLPLKVCQAAPFDLKIAVANSDYNLDNSSVKFEYKSTYRSSFQGALEPKIKNGMIRGWAVDNDNLNQKIDLYIYDDHNFICRLKANLYRKDIHKLKQGDGHYGYCSKLPDSFLDNQKHQLSVCWENSSVELKNSPIIIEKNFILNSISQRADHNFKKLVKLTEELTSIY